MPSKAFIKGFRSELANRSFALMTVRRMAGRLKGDDWFVFWNTYWDLEILNAERYGLAALSWGLDPAPGVLTKLKARLVSSVPRFLMVALVNFVYRQTIVYLDWLRELRKTGPAEAAAFLDFMVEQEEMQIEMMRLALAGRHAEIAGYAQEFFRTHGRSIPRVGFAVKPVSAGN